MAHKRLRTLPVAVITILHAGSAPNALEARLKRVTGEKPLQHLVAVDKDANECRLACDLWHRGWQSQASSLLQYGCSKQPRREHRGLSFVSCIFAIFAGTS